MKKINITELVLRDGHQCHIATRLRTEDMLPICPMLDNLNFWSIEAWGGATFDACVRYLKEDPWERLAKLRKALPNSKIQMLLRGQNLLGYRHYSDDVVEMFVKKSADNGVDVFRVFDALNDIRNIEVSIKAVKKYKKHAEGTISYTTSPVHNIEYFVSLGKKLEELGCDTIAIKDMAGLLTPEDTSNLVTSLVKNTNLPVHMHCHATSGLASINLIKAVEAGAEIIDTCNSSYADGASHPATESIVVALEGMGYKTGIDLSKIDEITEYLKENRKKYWQFESEFTGLDPKVLINQVPGGMISNLSNQLRDQGALDKMNEVLKEIPAVRKDLGYPPLVTPTSQIVGTQAALNIITGERYKTITSEVKNYFLGQYGMAPGKLNATIKKKAIGDQKEITSRPADKLKPEFNNLKIKSESFASTDEDILTYAMFPDIATTFLQERNAGSLEPEILLNKSEEMSRGDHFAPSEFNITLHGETYHINLTGSGDPSEIERPFYVSVDGISEEVLVETLDEIKVNKPNGESSSKEVKVNNNVRSKPSHDGCITTAMPGKIIDIKVNVGDNVSAGDSIIIIEAMKMENEIQASKTGTIVAINIKKGDDVSPNETLLEIQS
ncbi:MAG: oxaloacetate decarboxylase subunit alpha [Nitrosomonadales bacterium]|nr:oxaloacetate decarboxylase subunit alpha [Nitrosomonadales bacterium]|tara:strand:+ start:751 stop:2586 length:1836 start_codon:yes stop_codon:yes gene_type:complete